MRITTGSIDTSLLHKGDCPSCGKALCLVEKNGNKVHEHCRKGDE